MSEQRAQATTGGDDPQRTRGFDVGDTVDLRPDDGPWHTAPPDGTAVAETTAASGGTASAVPGPPPVPPSAVPPAAPADPAADVAPSDPPFEAGPQVRTDPWSDAAAEAPTPSVQDASSEATADATAEVPTDAAESPVDLGKDAPADTRVETRGAPAQTPRTGPTRSTLPRNGGGPERVKRPAAPPAGTGAGRSRRARLRLARIDPWSVLLLSLLISLFLAVVVVVAVVALYAVLEAAGVPDSINALVAEVTRTPGEAEPEPLLSPGRALRAAGVLAVVDVILLTALATLSAVLYNLCASFTGGLEVTLAEDS